MRRADSTSWTVLLEYPLYRLRKRIDAVLLSEAAIAVIEGKAGERRFKLEDERQVKSTLSICVIFMRAVTVCLYIQSFGVLGRRMDRLLTPARRIFSSGRSKPGWMTPVSLPLDSQTSL